MQNKELFLIRFDGPSLKGHSMDVRHLAPSLLSLNDLIREANKLINGDKAEIKVLVNADIQANCVTLSLDVIQHWEQIRGLINNPLVADAKTLIEWLLIGGCVGKGTSSLFEWLSWRNENVKEESILHKEEIDDNFNIKVDGNNNTIQINKNIYLLSENKKIIKAAKGVVSPIVNSRGIDEVVFKKEKEASISKVMAKNIYAIETEEEQNNEVQPAITAHISIHSPTLSERAKKWGFLYNGHVEDIDISETSIASDVMRRGKVVVGDTWKVKLLVSEKKTNLGYKNDYKALEVLDFYPGDEQGELPFKASMLLDEEEF